MSTAGLGTNPKGARNAHGMKGTAGALLRCKPGTGPAQQTESINFLIFS